LILVIAAIILSIILLSINVIIFFARGGKMSKSSVQRRPRKQNNQKSPAKMNKYTLIKVDPERIKYYPEGIAKKIK